MLVDGIQSAPALSMIRVLLSVILLLLSACSVAPQVDELERGLTATTMSTDLSELRVTTLNVFGPGFTKSRDATDCAGKCGEGCELGCEDKFYGLAHSIADSRSDIVILNEADVFTDRVDYNLPERLASVLSILTTQRWYWAFEQSCDLPGGYGNGLLSTAPITDIYVLELDGVAKTEPCYDVENPQRPEQRTALTAKTHGLVVIGVHLDHRDEATRDSELAIVLEQIDPRQPTIIAGDLNEGSSILDRHFSSDQFVDATITVDSTFKNGTKIDHIVFSGPLTPKHGDAGLPIAYTTDPGASSDHLAVTAVLQRQWTHGVVLETSSTGAPSDLLLYEPLGGRLGRGLGQLFRSWDGARLSARGSSNSWRSTWHTIIPGDFDGDGKHNDLLFYDRSRGQAEFYRVSPEGEMHLLRATNGWRRTWDAIIPVDLPSTRHTDLLFWDADGGTNGRGLGSLYYVYDTAQWSFIRDFRTWRPQWDRIVAGDFDGDRRTDDLFFYQENGVAAFLALEETVDDGVWARTLSSNPDVPTGAEQIVALDFGSSRHSDLLFYDRQGGQSGRGRGDLYSVSGLARVRQELRRDTWRPSWEFIVSGDFNDDGRRNELLFYDRSEDEWEIYTIGAAGEMTLIAGEA